MKIVKKSISLALAVLMIFSSVSAFASTLNDGLKRTMVAQFKFFDENGNETTKVYPGEKITAKLYVATDFVGGAHDFYILYDKTFMTLDLSSFVETADGYKLKSWTTHPEETDSPDPAQDKREGEFISDENGTQYPAKSLLKNGLLEADTFTTQGYGGIYVSGWNGKADYFDIDQWLYKFDFTVNSGITDTSVAKIFIPASARTTNDPSHYDGGTQIARVEESFCNFDYDLGSEAAQDPSLWEEEFSLETSVSDGTIALGINQGDTAANAATNTVVTYGGSTIYTPYLTLGGEETITWTVTDNDNYSEEVTATFGDLLSEHAPDYEAPFGYDFDGWATDNGAVVDTNGSTRVAAGGNTVIGTTTPKDVTVTFWPPYTVEYGDEVNAAAKWNGSISNSLKKKEKSAEFTYGTSPYLDPSWGAIDVADGYYFAGWTVLLDTEDLVYEPSFDDKVYGELVGSSFVFDELTKANYDNHIVDDGEGNLTLDLVPVILPLPDPDIIKFDPNGGNWSGSTEPLLQDATHTIRITTPAQPTKDNFTFKGWEDEDGNLYTTPAQLLPIYLRKFDISGDVRVQTYTAQWTGNEAKMNILVKLQNADDNGYTDSETTYSQKDVSFGDVVTYSELGISVPDGFVLSESTPESITITEYGQYYTVYLDRIDVDVKWNYMYTYSDSTSSKTETVRFGSKLDQPTPPTRTGWVFNGWYENVGLTDELEEGATAPLTDVEYYADWVQDAYELTWQWTDENGASHFDIVPLYSGDTITLKEMPNVTGYSFAWYENVPSDMKMPEGDLTIKGKYTVIDYTLKWVITGTDYLKTETKNYGDSITEPTDVVIPTGKSFAWENHDATMPAGNLTITGAFTDNLYTVTWIVGEGENQKTYTTPNLKYQDTFEDKVVPESDCPVGKSFGGWTTHSNQMPASDVTVYGSWNDNLYTITWIVGTGDEAKTYKTENVKYGDAVVDYTVPEDDYPTGKSFDSWESHDATMPASDMTVNGTWKYNYYTITWSIGDETYTTTNMKYGDTISAYTVPEEDYPAGMTFGRWVTAFDTMPASDMEILGEWAYINYTVKWIQHNIDGTETTTTDENKHINDTIYDADYDVVTGYDFAWDLHADKISTSDVTVHGYYTVHTNDILWKVKYTDLEGTAQEVTLDTNEDVAYGTSLTEILAAKDYSAVVPTGYKFTGWDSLGFETMPDNDIIVTTTLSLLEYTVTFKAGTSTEMSDGAAVEGESFVTKSAEYYQAVSDVEPAVYSYPGHYLVGWADAEEPGDVIDTENTFFDDTEVLSKTYIAVWDLLTYEPSSAPATPAVGTVYEKGVRFVAGTDSQIAAGAQIGTASEKTVGGKFKQLISEIAPATSTLSYPGYDFQGWAYSAGQTEAEDISTDTIAALEVVGTEQTYYAVWTPKNYTPGIAFDANGGEWTDGDVKKSIPQTFSSKIAVPVDPKRDGYVFAGWSTNKNDTAGSETTMTKAVLENKDMMVVLDNFTEYTYYAIWSTDATTPYTVTIHTPDTTNANYSVLTGDVIGKAGETGTTVTLADVYTERTGFEVDNLLTDASFVISYNGNYDIWLTRKTYTVKYYDEDKTTFIGSEDFLYGQTLAENAAMKDSADKSGYEFDKWVYDDGSAVLFYNVEVTDDVNVYASYTPTTDNLGVKIEIYKQDPNDLTKYDKVNEYTVTGLYTDSTYSYVFKAADVPEGCSATDYSSDPASVTVSTEEVKTIKVYFERSNKNVVLTFNYDGGKDSEDRTQFVTDSLANGATYAAPTVTKAYNEFDSWDPTYDGIVPDVSQTYTAQWNHYTMVSFNAGDGQFADDVETTVKVYEEDAITAPDSGKVTAPVGYEFAGWSADPNAEPENALETLPVAGSDDTITYYAIFAPKTYSIKFDAGEGKIGTESSSTLTQTYNQKYNVPADPERTGYRFIGWVLNNSNPIVADAIASATLADTVMTTDLEANPETYYACYEIITNKVTYYVDGDLYDVDFIGYGEEIANIEVDGKTVTWYSNSECTVPVSSWTMGTEAVKLYAVREEETIKVEFDPNGGKFADDSTGSKTLTFTVGEEIICDEEPVKQGYKFIGWDNVSDTNYKALWSANEYSIIFSVDDESEEISTIYGEAIEFPADPDEEGYLFEGWFDSEGKEYKDGDVLDFVPEEGFTISAKLTIESFMVYYYLIIDDSPVLVDMVTYDYGETIERDIKNISGAKNYGIDEDSTVAGPYSDAECKTLDSTDVMGTTLLKFYYTAEEKTYTVTFDPKGGKFSNESTDPAEVKFTEGEEVTYEEPVKVGYSFAGWDIVSDTLYEAIWVAKEYEIVFNVEDDSETIKTVFGEEIEFPAEPDIEGKTFDGWFTESDVEYTDGDILTFTEEPTDSVVLVLNAKLTLIKYTIKFVDEDGTTVLKEDKVEYGTTPTPPTTPSKDADAQYTYSFNGWDSEIVAVTGDKTYKATYSKTVNEYTIKFVNDDGVTILKQDSVAYGSIPVAPTEQPTKEADAQYTYTFKDWDSEIVAVTGDKTYTATYDKTVNKYTIKFVDEDGTTVLGQDEVEYGTMPEAPADPVKPADEHYSYVFNGWSPHIGTVTGDATYTATYKEDNNMYTIVFVDEDGVTELKKSEVAYGEMPEAPADPEKEADVQYTYTFAGWSPAVVAVTKYAKYTATYSKTVNKYTIKFVDEDGTTVLKEDEVEYGTMPTPPADPVKEPDAYNTYAFNGWDSEIVAVTGAKTYKATYSSTLSTADIVYMGFADLPHSASDPAGAYTQIDKKTVAIGSSLTPIEGPSITNYVFEGWFDGTGEDALKVESGTVNGNITLYARYSRVAVKLVAASAESTAMIERDGIVETYNTVETLPAGVTAVKAPVTDKYGEYSKDYEGFFVYGMVTNVAPSEIENFVKVSGDGRYELTLTAFDKLATGAIIKVYDNVTGELVEQFYFVVFGDLNGDGLVTSTDTALYNKETKNKDWSEGTNAVRYLIKAADLSCDGRFSSTDTSVVKACVKASTMPNQITGKTDLVS